MRLAKSMVVGHGLEPDTEMGPVQNLAQFNKLKEFLADAHQSGKVVAGGAPLRRPGYFIPPTIVRDVRDHAMVVREEQFGPILPVLSYTELDDAIQRINDSDYGLAATVWGTDVARAAGAAMRIQSGTVWVNKHMDIRADLPFRGVKQSGLVVNWAEPAWRSTPSRGW